MATKFVFVTGGVVSGLGKGITAAALGRLLKARGLKVRNQKFDPYLNMDPGIMSPTQHGEVFITEDGAETDLDIGHYERFTDENLGKESDITSGMVYGDTILKERKGIFMGTTVQVVPHIINEIKEHLFNISRQGDPDVVITEIGGTVGDMEGLPYLEAIRQLGYQVGKENVLYVHVTLVPFLRMAGEVKTKPTQHSVAKLLSHGIQPDVLVCRSEIPLERAVREKIALFCNVDTTCVIENRDCESVYEIPLLFEREGFGSVVCKKLGIAQFVQPDLSEWENLVERYHSAARKISIALVGKYVVLRDAYLSVTEALTHAGIVQDTEIDVRWINAEDLEHGDPDALLAGHAAIIVPGGFGPRGMEGMVRAAGYARRNSVPFLGIGLGMEMAVVEFARNVAGIQDAHSSECENQCSPMFYLPELQDARRPSSDGGFNSASGGGIAGATSTIDEKYMRRGAYSCDILPGSHAAAAYQALRISERHHHRWEFNKDFRPALEQFGMVFSGTDTQDGERVDIVEIAGHPWFVGAIAHPEFKSRPNRPHPLFSALVKAAVTAAGSRAAYSLTAGRRA
ncbi:MAG TPA: CTP synthase [Clostridia bacterium]